MTLEGVDDFDFHKGAEVGGGLRGGETVDGYVVALLTISRKIVLGIGSEDGREQCIPIGLKEAGDFIVGH